MEYTLEEIYSLVGKEDKVSTLTLKSGSDSYKIYGDFITVVFHYTQDEREIMDKNIINQSASSGYLKAEYLGSELETNPIKSLKINSEDIFDIWASNNPSKNTFHSKEKRKIKTIDLKINSLPKGRDFDWIYGFNKRLVKDNIGLCPKERYLYLGCKFYFEPEQLSTDELKEIFTEEDQLKKEIEFEFLGIKYIREESSLEERTRLAELIKEREKTCLLTLDKYLKESGSSLRKLVKENLEQATKMYIKVTSFKERRLNVTGKVPVYINLDSYLHIYMRHVEEMKINQHFEHKDNFQWNEEDVLTVMEKVIQKTNDEIQKYFSENPSRKYSKYGPQSIYFEGDYYTFHIEPNGRIITFHKNRKELETHN